MPRPLLSRGEMEVVRAVWKTGEAAVGDIYAAVAHSNPTMDYTTVQTYIRRLEGKGYIQARRAGRNKLYRPRVQAKQVRREAIRDLLNRLFDGQSLPLMKHLLADGDLSATDIAELKQMLDDTEP